MTPAPDLPASSGWTIAARVARTYLRPRWPAVSIAVLCAIAVAVFTGLLVKVLQPAVNGMVVHPTAAHLARIPLIIVALALARGAAQLGQAVLVNRIGNAIVAGIQLDLFRKLVRADLARLRASHSGGFVSSVLYDAGLIREGATTGLVNFVQQTLTLIAMAVVMATTDWRLGLFVLIAAPVVLVVLRRFSGLTNSAARGAMAATSTLTAALLESLDGVRVIKMENREAYEERRIGGVLAQRQAHILPERRINK